jgi:Cyclic nucleotide-binding domain
LVLKKLFGGGAKSSQELDIDDLIVLERYGEAEDKLKARLRANPKDLHSHVKLAEVYSTTQQVEKALEEYLFVADEFADDGFYDKAMAVAAKAAKLAPNDPSLAERIQRFEAQKRLEVSRTAVIDGLMAQSRDDVKTSVFEAQQVWSALAETAFIKSLAPDQLRKLFGSMALVKFPVGSIFLRAEQRLDELFLVARGEVEVHYSDGERDLELRSYVPGDIFGEAALFERKPWMANYRVGQAATLLKLTASGLQAALLGNADPRGLLDALRVQRMDREVAVAVQKLTGA